MEWSGKRKPLVFAVAHTVGSGRDLVGCTNVTDQPFVVKKKGVDSPKANIAFRILNS